MKIIKHGFVTPKEEYPRAYNAWPTVISLSDGTLLAAWSGNRLKHICPFGEVKAARSTDGGYTWGEEIIISESSDPSDFDLGYPSTARLEDGTLITTYYQAYGEDKTPSVLYTRWRLN